MSDFQFPPEGAMLRRCRYRSCQSVLSSPQLAAVAFCSEGCQRAFFKARCFVCEGPRVQRRSPDGVCGRPDCQEVRSFLCEVDPFEGAAEGVSYPPYFFLARSRYSVGWRRHALRLAQLKATEPALSSGDAERAAAVSSMFSGSSVRTLDPGYVASDAEAFAELRRERDAFEATMPPHIRRLVE